MSHSSVAIRGSSRATRPNRVQSLEIALESGDGDGMLSGKRQASRLAGRRRENALPHVSRPDTRAASLARAELGG